MAYSQELYTFNCTVHLTDEMATLYIQIMFEPGSSADTTNILIINLAHCKHMHHVTMRFSNEQ